MCLGERGGVSDETSERGGVSPRFLGVSPLSKNRGADAAPLGNLLGFGAKQLPAFLPPRGGEGRGGVRMVRSMCHSSPHP